MELGFRLLRIDPKIKLLTELVKVGILRRFTTGNI